MAPRTRRSLASQQVETPETPTQRVLITGANTGLGFEICRRLIDEFIEQRPPSNQLHLIITTRSSAKSSSTISKLAKIVQKKHAIKITSEEDPTARVRITSAELDLTELPSVVHAARGLRRSLPSLDAIICNAGIAGWTGLHWPRAILSCLLHPIEGTTWPSYLISQLGWRTRPQLGERTREEAGAGAEAEEEEEEPALGQVFCANVFGHYVLAHELGPLLTAGTLQPGPGRVVWLSSIETEARDLDVGDVQALGRDRAYNSSKRLTEVLALSAGLASTRASVRRLFSEPAQESYNYGRPLAAWPRQYVCHPGVVATEIIPLHPLLAAAKRASFYLARWLGSPWHPITAYKGATAPVWLALAPLATLDALEERDGPAKWGSATDWWGHDRVKRTEVDGWGWDGRVDKEAAADEEKERKNGRRRGAVKLTKEARKEFEDTAVKCWEAMEELRDEWYELMDDAGVIDSDA